MSMTCGLALKDCQLVPLSANHLDTVLNWRNAESIRAMMFSDHVITPDEHKRWFASLKNNARCDYSLFLYRSAPAGLSCFTEIDPESHTAEWGFYTDPVQAVKGHGTALGILSMNYAFGKLNLSHIYTYTFAFNQRALHLQEKLGFVRIPGVARRAPKSGQDYDVFKLQISKSQWDGGMGQ